MRAAAAAALDTLTDDERVLVLQVLDGWTDGQVARSGGFSRPTAHEHRKAVAAKLRPVFADVDPELADAIATELSLRLRHER